LPDGSNNSTQVITPATALTALHTSKTDRQFSLQDGGESPNVVVNDVLARRYWPDESALGRQISIDKDGDGKPIWRQVVGVVQGVRHDGLDFEPEPQVYAPFSQFSMPTVTIVIHTKGQPLSLVEDLRTEVLAVDNNQPVSDVRTMEQVVSESVAPRQFNMLLLGLFAGVALLLASISIYGVISYTVSRRTREIGIRIALGSGAANVTRLIVGQGLTLSLIGVTVGLAVALGLTRLLSSLLYQVSATDPYVYAGVSALLILTALLASYLPACRAANIDPIIALRHE
jgi:putative ABC transport system permease protein